MNEEGSTSGLATDGEGSKVAIGIAQLGVGAIASKAVALGAQVLLGWKLAQDDFAIWGLAIASAVLANAIRDGGMGRLIVQCRDSTNIRSMSHLAHILAISAGLLTLAAAPLAASLFDRSELLTVLLVQAIASGLSGWRTVHRARSARLRRFSMLARLDVTLSLLQSAAMVGCAFAGLGALSFAVPVLLTNVVGGIVYRRAIGPIEQGPRLTQRSLSLHLRAVRWLTLAAIATAMAASGDYIFVDRAAPNELAEYVFSFQLITALAAILGPAIQSVLVPTMSAFTEDIERNKAAYHRAVITAVLVLGPLTALASGAVPLALTVTWGDKWLDAIPISQVLVVALSFRLVAVIPQAMLQASQKWSAFARTLLAEAFAVVLFAYLGSLLGGALAIALAVAAGELVVAVWATTMARLVIGPAAFQTTARASRIAFPFVVIGLLVNTAAPHIPPTDPSSTLLPLILSLGLTAPASYLAARANRQEFKQLIDLARAIRTHI